MSIRSANVKLDDVREYIRHPNEAAPYYSGARWKITYSGTRVVTHVEEVKIYGLYVWTETRVVTETFAFTKEVTLSRIPVAPYSDFILEDIYPEVPTESRKVSRFPYNAPGEGECLLQLDVSSAWPMSAAWMPMFITQSVPREDNAVVGSRVTAYTYSGGAFPPLGLPGFPTGMPDAHEEEEDILSDLDWPEIYFKRDLGDGSQYNLRSAPIALVVATGIIANQIEDDPELDISSWSLEKWRDFRGVYAFPREWNKGAFDNGDWDSSSVRVDQEVEFS